MLSEARTAEARYGSGDARPLEGIPLGVKDLEDVAGMATTYGSVPFKDTVLEERTLMQMTDDGVI